MQQERQPQSIGSSHPDVDLEFGDGKWFVAVRRAEPQSHSTHERQGEGFFSHVDAARAAVDLAISRGLTVPTEAEMIEAAEEFRSFVDGEDRAFVM
ncbi:hypothetical protein [Sphingobium agri]|uniref:DUF2188 domain-containing protein n=1 Tax=Sphingobium agri TaxID=2933566 RepID=A0ABT0DWF7_9SPHN|nr:hypothetical protein [Sphingobium agri]MCK0531436.1 hypothetical protein [Sphingobium agri]